MKTLLVLSNHGELLIVSNTVRVAFIRIWFLRKKKKRSNFSSLKYLNYSAEVSKSSISKHKTFCDKVEIHQVRRLVLDLY